MSSTSRGGERSASDYYVTPAWAVEEFLKEFRKKLEPSEADRMLYRYVLDPCAGGDAESEMTYPTVLAKAGFTKIKTLDLRNDSPAEINGQNYLWWDAESEHYNLIITNPPFSHALPIIRKALGEVRKNGYVVMLLRLNFLESKERATFFKYHTPKYVFAHSKRMSFRKGGQTDSVAYAHFVWQKGVKEDTRLYVI